MNNLKSNKIIVLILLSVVFISCYILNTALSIGIIKGGSDDYFITLLVSFLLFFWGITMVYRVQFVKQRNILLAIIVISFLWIVLKFVKWILNNQYIIIYCDYLYYLPMNILPVLMFMLIIETFYLDLKHKKIIYSVIYCIISVFILLIFTNNFHYLIYKNYNIWIENKIAVVNYQYGIMHYFMLGFILFISIFSIILFFFGTRGQIILRQTLISLFLVSLFFLYIILYTIKLPVIRNTLFLKDFALTSVLFVNCILETMLYMGLIQNNGHYERNFKKSLVPICIYDENAKKLYSSELFDEERYIKNDANFNFKIHSVGQYYFVLEEDMTEMILLKNTVIKENAELKNINNMLKKMFEITSKEYSIKHRLQLIDEIENSIGKTEKELKEIIHTLPDKITEENYIYCKQKLGMSALHLGYMKQKCMLLLGAKEKKSIDYETFNLLLNIIIKDIKSVGFEDVAYNIIKKNDINFSFILSINDLINKVAKTFAFQNCNVLIIVDTELKKCVIEIDGNFDCTLTDFDENVTIKQTDDNIRLSFVEV